MTPAERAEKIVTKFMLLSNSVDCIEFCAAQIEEAEREVHVTLTDKGVAMAFAEGYAQGFKAAQEQAAGIALNAEINAVDEYEEHVKAMYPKMQREIHDRIRSMRPEGEK